MTKLELIELVRRIAGHEGTEDEIDEMIALLHKNVVDPNITKYIFWPDEEMTPTQIVDKALAYQPTPLGSSAR